MKNINIAQFQNLTHLDLAHGKLAKIPKHITRLTGIVPPGFKITLDIRSRITNHEPRIISHELTVQSL